MVALHGCPEGHVSVHVNCLYDAVRFLQTYKQWRAHGCQSRTMQPHEAVGHIMVFPSACAVHALYSALHHPKHT